MSAPPDVLPLTVLVVDDEANIRKTLAVALEIEGHRVIAVSNATEALAEATARSVDLAFVDLRLGTASGLDLIPALLARSPWTWVVVITAFPGVATAVEGYAVEEAADGQEALDTIARSSPDLVILDLNMPVMDGMCVLERLGADGSVRRPKVVVLTAYGSIPAAVRATRLGAADFVEKPVTPDELREMVRGVLGEAGEEPPRPPTEQELAGGYDAVLARVRRAMRADDVATAESLLMHAADLSGGRDAPYFNLLGVLYEAQGNWRLAKKFYHKAMRADRAYEPAEHNVRRVYELESFGRTAVPVALGDEQKPSALEQLRRDTLGPHARGSTTTTTTTTGVHRD